MNISLLRLFGTTNDTGLLILTLFLLGQTDVDLLSFARKEMRKTAPRHVTGMTIDSASGCSTEMPSSLQSPTPAAVRQDETVSVMERTQTSSKMETAHAELESSSETVGTQQMLKYMIALRGPKSLFQSADITFLASLVFGSFGFGATELFRRSISSFFFSESGDQVNEVAVLLAAALATVLTAAAASPFEVLRVRSMALLDEKPWTEVLREFLVRILRVRLHRSCQCDRLPSAFFLCTETG